MNHIFKKLFCLLLLSASNAANHPWTNGLEVYAGAFDFEHSDRYFMLGANYIYGPEKILSPKISAFVSDHDMFFVGIGPRLKYKRVYVSIGPGYYHQGTGFDLGYDLEFKSEIGYQVAKNINVGIFHLSNAGISDTNPGINAAFISFTGF